MPLDPSLTVAVIVFILTNLLKDTIERLVPPSSPVHDTTMRAVPLVMGGVGKTVAYLLVTAHPTWAGVEGALITGLAGGAVAIGAWHTGQRQSPAGVAGLTPVPAHLLGPDGTPAHTP